MNAEIVPFGKYKGQPVEALIADRSYVEWLSGQPWFRERYAPTYQMIINYGQALTETPEHNEMQIAFLDRTWRKAVAQVAYKGHLDFDKPTSIAEQWVLYLHRLPAAWQPTTERSEAGTSAPEFEVKGWDVVYSISGATYEVTITRPGCSCADERHWRPQSDGCASTWPEGRPSFGRYNGEDELFKRELEKDGISWMPSAERTICVECKPDLGDDFPAVLRQIKAREKIGRQVLLVRRTQFERVGLEDVRKVFRSAEIVLLLEEEVG